MGRAIAKLAPPTPRKQPKMSSRVYVGMIGNSSTPAGIADREIPMSASRRPFTDWNRLPSVTRTMDAASTGTATRKPAWVGDSTSCLEMNGASGPNITQAVKPVSKYRKQASRAFQLPLLRDAMTCFIRLPQPVLRASKKNRQRCASIEDVHRLAALPWQIRRWTCRMLDLCNGYAMRARDQRMFTWFICVKRLACRHGCCETAGRCQDVSFECRRTDVCTLFVQWRSGFLALEY